MLRTLIELFSTIQKSLTATATFDPQKTLDFGSLFYGGKNAHCGATLSRRTFFLRLSRFRRRFA